MKNTKEKYEREKREQTKKIVRALELINNILNNNSLTGHYSELEEIIEALKEKL